MCYTLGKHMRERMKKPTVLHHVPKHIFWFTGLGVVVLIGMVFTFAILTYTKPVKTSEALKAEAQSTLTGATTVQKSDVKTIQSDLGFSLQYDTNTLDAHGQTTDPSSTDRYVSGEDFTGDELSKTRSYSIVKLTVKSDATSYVSAPEMVVLTNIRKNHLQEQMNLPANKGKSKLAVWVETMTASQEANGYKMTNTTTTSINAVEYTVVDFVYDSSHQYGVASETVDRYYLTVQNDRAYEVAIHNINSETEKQQIPLFEQALQTVTYSQPDTSKLSRISGSVVLASTLPTDNIKTPAGSINEDTLYSIVAKNQPAIVRIGTMRCGTLVVSFPDATSAKVNDVCNGGIGSGSFISSDGYIATNGHVTRVLMADMVNGYIGFSSDFNQLTSRSSELLGFLVKLGKISEAQKSAFMQALSNKDAEALSVITSIGSAFPSDSLSITNDNYTYAIQTSNEPMRLKGDDEAAFTYSKTVIPAKFIAANFYEGSSEAALSSDVLASGKSDVSILKVNGGPYPTVTLGSLNSVAEGDKLVALGYPAFVDKGLQTKQAYTVPSATSGRVLSVASDESRGGTGHKFIYTTVPIAHGNSGGPSFDANGNVVGLNTYSQIQCASGDCFGNGIIRDIADVKKLAKDNDVTISSTSEVNDKWSKGLESFQAEKYGDAASYFDASQRLYPANYLAVQLGDIATENAPSLFRIAQNDVPRLILFYAILVVGMAVVGCIVLAVIFMIRGHRRTTQLIASVPGR